MKMILKVIAAPFALVLALLTALCWFLFDLCAFFLTIASVIVAVLGIGLFSRRHRWAGLCSSSLLSCFLRMACRRWLAR